MNSGYPPYPNSQMPGQNTNQPSYPIYPPAPGSGTCPAPGFNTGGFSQPSPYPPQPTPGYPQQSCGYPPQQTGAYPPQQGGGYPPSTPSYPQQPSGYPQQQSAPGYPPQSAPGYPPQSASGYPPQSASGYPSSAASSYPPATAYPSSGYPATTGYSAAAPQAPPLYPSQTCPAPNVGGGMYPTQAAYGAMKAQPVGQCERAAPTVIPVSPFNPRQDAEILRKAMKGFGTDEKAVIGVLTKRSNSQRLEIASQFKAMYGKDLISDLKSELSGKFEDVVVALMTPLPEYLAKEIYHAIEGLGTNEDTLVEILCTSTNAQIFAIRDAYQRVFGRSLENDLCGDTSGYFRRLLISVVQGRRSENQMVDEAAAGKDARDLMSAGVLRLGTDESTFNAILCTRSYAHLRRVLMEYQRLSGHHLDHDIKREFSGDICSGLLAIVHSVEDKSTFFAERLRDSIACVGTKDRQLIRIVVSRCEIDMQDIKRAYQRLYGKSVEQDISGDTSGDYKKALLSLIGY